MKLYGTLQELSSLTLRRPNGDTIKFEAQDQTFAGEVTVIIPDLLTPSGAVSTDTLVLRTVTQTLTNKTLTTPTITDAALNSSSKIVIPLKNNTQMPTAHDTAGGLIWNTSDNLLTVGIGGGATYKTMVDLNSTQTAYNKTLSGGVLSTGSVLGGSIGGSGAPTSINNINKLALADIGANVGASQVVITDTNKEVRTEATLSKVRGGTGADLSNVDFPQNIISKILTNITDLTSLKVARAAPTIASSVLTPSASKEVIQRISTAANFNEIASPEDGRYYILMNASASDITIGNETGTAANQIVTGTGAAFTFKAGTSLAAAYDGASSKWRLSGGAGGGGGGTTDVITQVGHGFAVGDAVYLNGSTYAKALATAANTAEVVGVVSKVVSNDAFELTLSGEISGLSGLTPGEVYFLGVDPLNPGKLTIVEPSVVGQVSLPVGVASSASTLYVAPKRGVVVGAANARTTISVGNNQATNVVSVTNYNSLKLEGELNVTRSSGGNQRAYYTVEAAKNGAGVWQVSASYTGDDVLYTTLPSWDVASNNLQVTMPLVTNFSSASLTYSLNAPAVGASLPLAIDSSSLNIVSEAPLSYRNRIINGDMRIDQRNSGAALSYVGSESKYNLDRWTAGIFGTTYPGGILLNIQQSTDAPAGFTNSLRVTAAQNITFDSNKLGSFITHNIEGNNVADFAFGTASAAMITLSFWVKSNKTGTVSVAFENSATDRAYGATVSITQAATWERKTITITGDTLGTWLSNNGKGMSVTFGIGNNGSWLTGAAGSWSATRAVFNSAQTNFLSATNDYLAITGVQLEVG
ncbi:MAG: hypothetical protein EBR09_12760, partial [Proteobacteria bacterium]|nr:hypothetical protein [Pseudomonadota bacterium]